MKTKYLLFGAIGLVALSSFGAKKGLDTKSIISQLRTTLRTIRRVGFSADGLNVEIDVEITNPTDKQLNLATAGAVTVKRLFVYDRNGTLVATAEPNINALSIVPGGSVILENIPISASYGSILDSIFGGISTDPDDYTVEAELEALGTTITV